MYPLRIQQCLVILLHLSVCHNIEIILRGAVCDNIVSVLARNVHQCARVERTKGILKSVLTKLTVERGLEKIADGAQTKCQTR